MRTKKCRVCRCDFIALRPLQVACSVACAVELSKKQKQKKATEAKRIERKADAEKREKLKSRSDWMRDAQTAFNAFIRKRDQLAGYPCISSGRTLDWTGNAVDAGHYRSTGSAPHLRFCEANCHAQSKHDNRYLSGNAVDYRIGLIARIGLASVEALEADQTPRHYSIEDLKHITATYKQKLKDLNLGRIRQSH